MTVTLEYTDCAAVTRTELAAVPKDAETVKWSGMTFRITTRKDAEGRPIYACCGREHQHAGAMR